MHIWYIHHYGGGPGLGSYDRPYQLARAWQSQGHSVTVFIARFHHLLEKDAAPEPEFEIDGVRYVALPARSYAQNGTSRLANIWDFSRNLYAAGQRWGRSAPKPDVVIASSPHPFSIFAAHRLARRHGAKLAFEIRDIWPLSITEILGTSSFHPFVQMCAFAERFALKNADLIASVLPRADRYLVDRGYGAKPFVWVPNGFSAHKAEGSGLGTRAQEVATLVAGWRGAGSVVIAHAGSLGKHNAADLLLKALAHGKCKGEAGGCRVLLIGNGEQELALKALCKAQKLDEVHFVGRVSKAEVPALLDQADIGYGGVRSLDRLYRYGVSLNKFADYYAAYLPVVLPIEPCGDPVSESGGGIARRAETPEAVWKALRELILLPPDERRALGEKGRAYMAREYDYDMIARRYVEAIAAA